MSLNLIARSVFTLAVITASAAACSNVAANAVDCPPAKSRVWRGEDGSKWILAPSGNLIRQPRRITNENIAQYAALAAVTVLDMHSTGRAVAAGKVREGNPLMASNGGLSISRFTIMSGVAAGLWLLHDTYLKPRAVAQGKKESRSVRIIRWSMLAGRSAIVINNYAR